MDYFPIIMSIAGCTFTLIASMIAMMLWVRSEANADRRDIINLIIAIKDEMKDFHTRLCSIEERRKEK